MNAKLLETEMQFGTPQPCSSSRWGHILVLALAGCEGRTPTCEVEPGSEATGRLRISLDLDDSDPLADEMRAAFDGTAHLGIQHHDEYPDDCSPDPDAITLEAKDVTLGWSDRYTVQSGWLCAFVYLSVLEYTDTAFQEIGTCIGCSAESEPACIQPDETVRIDLRARCSDECEQSTPG